MTKQYLAFSGFAVVRLLWLEPRRWRWIAAGMVASAAIVTLPLALWHPSSFARSVLFLQANEPFRIDSLSFLTWAAHAGWGQGTYRWAVGAGTIASIVSVLTTRNTAAGFAASVATTTVVMFAFGSKAFCNYYFFVIGALCAAVAAASSAAEDDV